MVLSGFEQDRLRLAAFAELELLSEARGFATYSELTNFELEGQKFPLIDQSRGIKNRADFDETIAIVSSTNGPYGDHIGDDGLFRYAPRTGNSATGDNRKLQAAMLARKPIIFFEKTEPTIYVPVVPAFVVGQEDEFFVISLGDHAWRSPETLAKQSEIDRRYVLQEVKRRVHQPVFRARVIVAYQAKCAICQLAHPELLDAAHIVADSQEGGIAHVTNGLALCKLHHAAYDNDFLGISPDYFVKINADLLAEVDGPMLKHGIQEMDGIRLTLPKRKADWPAPDALDSRFTAFHKV
ncbi:HNH endonuclease [soil metagenome]